MSRGALALRVFAGALVVYCLKTCRREDPRSPARGTRPMKGFSSTPGKWGKAPRQTNEQKWE